MDIGALMVQSKGEVYNAEVPPAQDCRSSFYLTSVPVKFFTMSFYTLYLNAKEM